MTAIVRTPTSRIVRTPAAGVVFHGGPTVAVAEEHRRALAILLLVLPIFGQTFYYLLELPVPYFLSKAWPFLMLPLSLYALFVFELPYKAMFALLLAYCMGWSPLLGMIYFGNGYLDALTTGVKILPFTYYFGFAALLAWLRPQATTITRAFVVLGAVTYVTMWLLWILAPEDWYGSDPAKGKLLMFEYERGNRIYMPMFFGMIFLFYLTRRFCRTWEWWVGLAIPAIFASQMIIYKQRISILAAVIVVYAIVISSTRGTLRRFLVACGLLAGSAVAVIVSGPIAAEFAGSLGGSLSVRMVSFATAIDFLGNDPLRWIFGVGATTRFSTITLAELFGNKNFYLADLGWLGIVFEYGLIGALLVIGVYLGGLLFTWQTARVDGSPLIRALADYMFFLFITSTVYSFVFTPGELATILAVAAYLRSQGPSPWVPPPRKVDTILQRSGRMWITMGGARRPVSSRRSQPVSTTSSAATPPGAR